MKLEDEEIGSSKSFDWTELFDAMVKRSEAEKKTATLRQAELLKTRARELARPLPSADEDVGEQHLLFKMGEEKYALKSRAVQGVAFVGALTRVPRAPAVVSGVFSRRGVVFVALDTARLLRLGEGGRDAPFAITLADVAVNVALMVEEVTGTAYVTRATVREGALDAVAFAGITEDRRIILDAAALWQEAAKALGLPT